MTDPADAKPPAQPATGIVFNHADQAGLRWAIDRGLSIWRDKPLRDQMIRSGMSKDWSWRRSAQDYVSVYKAAVKAMQPS